MRKYGGHVGKNGGHMGILWYILYLGHMEKCIGHMGKCRNMKKYRKNTPQTYRKKWRTYE
jgi:hypothetical protein